MLSPERLQENGIKPLVSRRTIWFGSTAWFPHSPPLVEATACRPRPSQSFYSSRCSHSTGARPLLARAHRQRTRPVGGALPLLFVTAHDERKENGPRYVKWPRAWTIAMTIYVRPDARHQTSRVLHAACPG